MGIVLTLGVGGGAASQGFSRQYLPVTVVSPLCGGGNTSAFVRKNSDVIETMDAAVGADQLDPIVEAVVPLSGSSTSEPLQTAPENEEDQSVLPLLARSEPHYYRIEELAVQPSILQDVPSSMIFQLPDAPLVPVKTQLLLNEEGEVDHVLFEDAMLSEEAERVIKGPFAEVKFHPGRLDDQPVKS